MSIDEHNAVNLAASFSQAVHKWAEQDFIRYYNFFAIGIVGQTDALFPEEFRVFHRDEIPAADMNRAIFAEANALAITAGRAGMIEPVKALLAGQTAEPATLTVLKENAPELAKLYL